MRRTDGTIRARVPAVARGAMGVAIGVAVCVATCVALAGCGSSDATHVPGDFTDTGAASGPAAAEAPAEPTGRTITIPEAENRRMLAFINRRATLLADHVEIDCSRKPFLSGTTFTTEREDRPDRAVQRTDSVDGARGVTTITLTNMSGIRTNFYSLPRVRIGDGLEVVGVDRIVLRYWTKQTTERPIHFRAVGGGNAAFLVEGPPQRKHKGSSVTLTGEMTKGGSGYVFRENVQARP